MTKEEDFFKENFPEYVTEKGEFLSPYWDLFRAGVICATFELKVKIEELEKENAELDCQRNRNKSCYSCANATERCFRNEIGCPCQKYKSYKEENAELKAYNEKLLDGNIEKLNKIVKLQNRNGELAGQVASLERWFGEAKKIIGNLYAICKDNHYPNTSVLMEQAEQFLKENK